ncbi:MAG: dipeptidase E [Candidatus Azotimanducaceae bacterium]|jgi:dipeptidase E
MIILTSSVASVADHIYKNYLSDKDYKTVLFIDTAAEPEIGKAEGDDDWLQADLKGLRDQGYQVDRWSVTGKTREEIEAEIDKYDVIYMCGGNTIFLLQQLQITDSFNLIIDKVKSGKPYIGTSAGSIIAGPKIPVYLEDSEGIQLDDYTGFQFIDTIVVPHWGSEHFKEMYLEERLKLAYKDSEPPFLLLSDYHYAVVGPEGNMKVINANE